LYHVSIAGISNHHHVALLIRFWFDVYLPRSRHETPTPKSRFRVGSLVLLIPQRSPRLGISGSVVCTAAEPEGSAVAGPNRRAERPRPPNPSDRRSSPPRVTFLVFTATDGSRTTDRPARPNRRHRYRSKKSPLWGEKRSHIREFTTEAVSSHSLPSTPSPMLRPPPAMSTPTPPAIHTDSGFFFQSGVIVAVNFISTSVTVALVLTTSFFCHLRSPRFGRRRRYALRFGVLVDNHPTTRRLRLRFTKPSSRPLSVLSVSTELN
jgi:hypothetical protein